MANGNQFEFLYLFIDLTIFPECERNIGSLLLCGKVCAQSNLIISCIDSSEMPCCFSNSSKIYLFIEKASCKVGNTDNENYLPLDIVCFVSRSKCNRLMACPRSVWNRQNDEFHLDPLELRNAPNFLRYLPTNNVHLGSKIAGSHWVDQTLKK